jgi:exonuclease SbcD
MADSRPVTIISDIHYGYAGSRVSRPAQLAPIFEASSLVICNGDTTEQREEASRRISGALLDELRSEAARYGCDMQFITGNHDPAASDTHHLDMCDGHVLVTHGDVLFDSITPWSSNSRYLKREYSRLLDELSLDETGFFERHLLANKQVSLMIAYRPPRVPANRLGHAMLVLSELWPFYRPLQIIKAWIDAPKEAFRAIDRFRPNAQIIVFGHVHFPGVWIDARGRYAVNTGSFTPPLGAAAFQIHENEARYRTLKRMKRDVYHFTDAGRPIPLNAALISNAP